MESTSAAALADLSPSGTQTQVITVDDSQPQVMFNKSHAQTLSANFLHFPRNLCESFELFDGRQIANRRRFHKVIE